MLFLLHVPQGNVQTNKVLKSESLVYFERERERERESVFHSDGGWLHLGGQQCKQTIVHWYKQEAWLGLKIQNIFGFFMFFIKVLAHAGYCRLFHSYSSCTYYFIFFTVS